ncbi:MAG: amidohydrolase family protein, partial [Clostridiales bacterium]|nr:amidohydrolase family protein [Clostridiales bacterium]
MIIDVHAHIGYDHVFDVEVTEDYLLSWVDKYKVDISIVQPLICRPYLVDTREIHNRIYRLICKYPGRFLGMASIDPHFRPEDYEVELTRCVKELGFVGAKITPIGHAAHPSSKDSMQVYEICRKLNIPVMIHTGAGTPFSAPMSMMNAVTAFKDVKFIMAHAGSNLMFQEALYIARTNDNVYLEPSWLDVLCVKTAVKVLGA